MWSRTFAGLLLGLVLSISLFVTFGYASQLPKDVILLVGFIGVFTIWAGISAWFYCAESILRPSIICFSLTLVLSLINGVYYTEIL